MLNLGGMTMEDQLAEIDTMRRVWEKYGLWAVASANCPMPTESQAQVEAHRLEMNALLHYARIGVMAAHGKL